LSFDWSAVTGATVIGTSDPWVVERASVETFIVYSGGRHLDGSDYVYDLLLKGSPPLLLPVVRAPVLVIEESLAEGREDIGPHDVDWDAVEGSTIDVAPTAWHVTLTGGERIVVYAHRYRREGGEYLFTLPLQGGRIQLPIARISDHLVAAVAEGPPLD
jgi:hypothetical protein